MGTYFTFIIHRIDIEDFKEAMKLFPTDSVEVIGHYGIPTKDPIYEVIELFVNIPNRTNKEIVNFIDRAFPYVAMHQSLSNFIFLGTPAETNGLINYVYKDGGAYFYYDILSTEERYLACLSVPGLAKEVDIEALRYDPGSGGYWHRPFNRFDSKLFSSDDSIELEAVMTGIVYNFEIHDYVDCFKLEFARLKTYLLI